MRSLAKLDASLDLTDGRLENVVNIFHQSVKVPCFGRQQAALLAQGLPSSRRVYQLELI